MKRIQFLFTVDFLEGALDREKSDAMKTLIRDAITPAMREHLKDFKLRYTVTLIEQPPKPPEPSQPNPVYPAYPILADR